MANNLINKVGSFSSDINWWLINTVKCKSQFLCYIHLTLATNTVIYYVPSTCFGRYKD